MGNPDNNILLKVIAQDEYSAQLKKARDAVNGMSKEQIDALKRTTAEQKKAIEAAKAHADQMEKLGKIAKGAAVAGIGVLAAAIGDSIKETMDYNKSIRDLAQNLAITTEETSRIVQTADDFTVSQEAVTTALQMAVKKGMKPSIDTLAQMADLYNSISDPTERAAKLTEVFGRNWAALTPMLKEGGQAIREAAAAQDEALIVTEEQAKKTRELEQNFDALGDKVTALKLKIGNGFMPAAVETTDVLTRFVSIVDGSETQLQYLNRQLGYSMTLFGNNSDEANKYRDAISEYTFNLQRAHDWQSQQNQAIQEMGSALSEVGPQIIAEEEAMRRANDVYAATQRVVDLAKLSMADFNTQVLYANASVGLAPEAQLQLAKSLGLVKDESYAAAQKLFDLRREYEQTGDIDNYMKKVYELNGALGSIPRDIQIRISLSSPNAGDIVNAGNPGGIGSGGSKPPSTTKPPAKQPVKPPKGKGPPAAMGANYTVPAGYNESWMQPASSGERVIIIPQSTTVNTTVNASGSQSSADAIAATVSQRVGRQLRAARNSGAGYRR